jgi:hypothetical protein
LSKDAEVDANGQVQVGAVSEKTIDVTDITFVDDNRTFLFEPLESDTTGRVRNNGEDFEDMDLTIQWTINNYQYVGASYVEFKLPAGVYNAITAGYITLPDGFTDTQTTQTVGEEIYHIFKMDLTTDAQRITESKTGDAVLNYTYTNNDGIETVVFSLTLKFNWGTTFGGENPGTYYDTNDTGKLVSYDQVKATLTQFKTTMHNMTFDDAFNNLSAEEQEAQYTANPIADYLVVIYATVK